MNEDDDRGAFLSRIGTFFLLLGFLLIVLFIASDIGENTIFVYFFSGIILMAIGFLFKRLGAPTSYTNRRFEGIRRLQQKSREAKEKREAADDKQKRN